MRSISNRDYVIQTASNLFLIQGFANTSMEEVVKHSSVSKSNIYYHFKSKEELTLAVLEDTISSLQRLFYEHVLAETGAFLPRLEHYINLLIEDLVEHGCRGGCPLLSLMAEAGKTNEQVRLRLAQFFTRQDQIFTQLLEEGQSRGEIRSDLPPHMLSSLIGSWLEGSLMLTSIHRGASSLREECKALLKLLAAS